MEKPAETAHPIEELLRRRWSPRAFDERLVEPEKLARMLEAARWSASCFNEQPWSFIVATRDDAAEFARLLSCLVEGNQAWAAHAPVLMVSVARLTFVQNGKPNRTAIHDVGLATSQMILQAMAMGLFMHPMAVSASLRRACASLKRTLRSAGVSAPDSRGRDRSRRRENRQSEAVLTDPR
jgi:nitroreductase